MFKRKSLSNIAISIFLIFGSSLNSYAIGNRILKVKRKPHLRITNSNEKGNTNFNNNVEQNDNLTSTENEPDIKEPPVAQNKVTNPLGKAFSWTSHIPGFSGQKLDSDTAFLDYLFRDIYVQRWNNLNSREKHNLSEHSAHAAYVAHFLAQLRNKIYKNDKNYKPLDPYKATVLALYHDVLEIFTGDMPTTTKYRTDDMKPAYSKVEDIAKSEALSLLPNDFKEHYKSIISPDKDDPHVLIVKEADIIANYIISLKEVKLGSRDFIGPCRVLRRQINELAKVNPEVKYFVDEFLSKLEKRHHNLRRCSCNQLKKGQ